ncbi:MAG: hypothetical protein ACRCSN_04765 [Dermatophilaceae bacterium]
MPALSKEDAKKRVLLLLAAGASAADAMDGVGRTRKTYENWRAEDARFAADADVARANATKAKARGQGSGEVYSLSFADWRRQFLGRETYPHQQMWIDVLEGREPDVFHPSIRFERGGNSRLLCINTPPFHAKSATITVEYTVYRLCMNPAFRVMLISKTAEAASKFLYSVRTILTDPHYADLHAAYAPSGSFKPERGEGRWGNNLIYLANRSTDAVDKSAKDPSVQAVGLGGQVYGARCDLIILDDAVDDSNAAHYEKQFDWLTRTVMSRAKAGKVLLVGTRVAPRDLYSHVLDGDNYLSGTSPWTYLAQPAVLEMNGPPEEWVTLWPKSHQPLDEASDEEPGADGLYEAWSGKALEPVRGSNRPGVWALVYQQQQVSEDMTFHPLCVHGSTDRRRKPGPLRAGEWGGRPSGMDGLQVVGSIDPAGTGEAFMLVYALDRSTKERWLLNCWTGSNTKPSWYRERIEAITPEYGVQEWIIESNAYASWLIHDEQLNEYAQQNGVRILPHYTGRNKIDPDFGVASMTTLFGSVREKTEGGEKVFAHDSIIHLPDPDHSAGVKALVDQLLTWVPGKSGGKLRQDGPMALWIAETRVRTHVAGFRQEQQTHSVTRFTTARSRSRMHTRMAGAEY